MERRVDTMREAAGHLLDTLESGKDVTLEITARDEEAGGLLQLITEIHRVARTRRKGISIERVGERAIRLMIAT